MPRGGCHQHLCSQGESLLPPTSPGGSPRSARVSHPGSFQSAASALGLRTCKILGVSCQSWAWFPPSLWLSCTQALLAFQARCSGTLLPGIGPLGWGAWCRAQTPHCWGRPSSVGLRSYLWVTCPGIFAISPPLLLTSLWVCLHVFTCGDSFLLVFSSFS